MVTFSIAVSGSGVGLPSVGPTLSNLNSVTDGNGKAITIFTSGRTDMVRAVITDGDAAIVLTH
jgi:hypothetical protein